MPPELEAGQPTDDEILQSTQPSAPAAAPAEPAFDPQQFGYNFRQQTIYPKDRAEVTELMQLGHSFRTNKPKWEQERQAFSQFEARKEEYQRYDQLSAALKANPEFRKELETLAQKYNGQPSQPQPSQPSAIPPELMEKINGIEQWKAQQETREADNALKQELDAVQQANPSYDWKTDSGEGTLRQQLLKYMHEKRVYDPEIALAAMMHKADIQKARFEAERKAADEAAKARKAGVVAPGAQPAPQVSPQAVNHKAMSYDQLEDAALASLGR